MHAPAAPRTTTLVCLSICAILLAVFGVLSTVGVLHKSATYDEPMHALAGYIHRQFGDYRMNFEDPPLWQRWAALTSERERLSPDFASANWKGMADNSYLQWQFTAETLFRGGAMNDGVALISRMRAMMVPIGVALGALIAAWAWRLAGPIAAVVALALFAFDPNFIGHTPLVKNDVAMALMTIFVVAATAAVGRRVTGWNATTLAVLVAVAVNVKFSAVLLGPIVLTLLVLRAATPVAWPVFNLTAANILQRLFAAVSICAGIAIVSVIFIWGSYGFRFAPTNDPKIALNTNAILREAIADTFRAKNPSPDPFVLSPQDSIADAAKRLSTLLAELDAQRNKLATTAAAAANPMPELSTTTEALKTDLAAFSANVKQLDDQLTQLLRNAPAPDLQSDSFKAQMTQARVVLADGINGLQRAIWNVKLNLFWRSLPGREPDAFSSLIVFSIDHKLLPSPWLHGMLFVHARSQVRGSFLMEQKSLTGFRTYFPLAMWFKTPVATILLLAATFVIGAWALSLRAFDRRSWIDFWPVACLLVPPGIYLFSVMTSNLNIGFRHVLPVYPFAYVVAGVVAAFAVRQFGPWTYAALGGVAAMLVVESAAVWPNGVAYFNVLHGGSKGGLLLLADSNLDWGQDFPALAKWQVQNPTLPVAFSYYPGVVDPAAYGVKASILPPGPVPEQVRKQYVIAIGATNLQAVYGEDVYAEFRKLTPLAILNGTIYLYDLGGLSKPK